MPLSYTTTRPYTYVKINKIDNNGIDNSITLGQATKLNIKYTTELNSSIIGNILERTEYPTYWLYKVQSLGSDTADNFVKDYKVSASITVPYYLGNGSPHTIDNWDSTLIGTNTNLFFNTSSGIFTFNTLTPNTLLNFTCSFTTLGNAGLGQSYPIYFYQSQSNNLTTISEVYYSTLGTTNIIISASLYPLEGDQYYISLTKPSTGMSVLISNAQLLLTQSIAPITSSNDLVTLEPYITEPNFYNSDNNALLNSINDQRFSTFALDVDYSEGITPVNFSLLISGTATPATIPDSNYTSKKSILSKYEGSKSTSQFLNKWTPGDTGTYGKLPTVESLRNAFIIAGWIGGWPPEIDGASAANINYIVREDGTLIKPWSTKNALSDLRQYFTDGERVTISPLQSKNLHLSYHHNKLIIKFLEVGIKPKMFYILK